MVRMQLNQPSSKPWGLYWMVSVHWRLNREASAPSVKCETLPEKVNLSNTGRSLEPRVVLTPPPQVLGNCYLNIVTHVTVC